MARTPRTSQLTDLARVSLFMLLKFSGEILFGDLIFAAKKKNWIFV